MNMQTDDGHVGSLQGVTDCGNQEILNISNFP